MSKYILKDFPDSSALLFDYQSQSDKSIPRVNSHVHTPYSFSYFTEITTIFQQSLKDGVSVLGINDFHTAKGFRPAMARHLPTKRFTF